MDFAFLADDQVKVNEVEKLDKYLDLARELKIENEGDVILRFLGRILEKNLD